MAQQISLIFPMVLGIWMILERIPGRGKRTKRNEALRNTGSETELREELGEKGTTEMTVWSP